MSALAAEYVKLVSDVFETREYARTMRRCSDPCVTDPCGQCQQREQDVSEALASSRAALRAFESTYSVRSR